VSSQFWYLGHAKGSKSVHPIGNPMCHSPQAGFTRPPRTPVRERFWPWCRPTCLESDPIRVGSNNPGSLAAMPSSHLVRPHNSPLRIETQLGKVSKDGPESPNREICDVLHEDVAWSHFANDAGHFLPEPAFLASNPSSVSDARDVIAGEAPRDDMDASGPWVPVEGPHIVPDGEVVKHSIPLAGKEDLAGVGINLNSADGAPSKEFASQDASSCSCKKCQLIQWSSP
jgi:hypothetical protein